MGKLLKAAVWIYFFWLMSWMLPAAADRLAGF
jgi:hypothetical protein